MADFYRVSGNAGPAGSMISFIGKTPLAVAGYIAASGGSAIDLRGELGVNYAVPAILNTIESNVSVLAYQIENGSGGNISLLLEGAAHFGASDIQAIIRSAGATVGNNAVDVTGSMIAARGFKLSYT